MSDLSRSQAKLLRQLQGRHGRRKSDHFLAEGVRCCREALARRPDWIAWALVVPEQLPDELTAALHNTAVDVVQTDVKTFADLAPTTTPQGIMLVLRRPPEPTVPPAPFVLVLDRLADPGNLGTILRTAWAVGLPGLVVTTGTADPFGPKAVRAGMGAQFALDVACPGDLAAVRAAYAARGVDHCWLAVPEGGVDCFTDAFAPAGALLVVGNEAHGVAALADAETVSIPMPGRAESLNVAQAATVLLFETVRRGRTG